MLITELFSTSCFLSVSIKTFLIGKVSDKWPITIPTNLPFSPILGIEKIGLPLFPENEKPSTKNISDLSELQDIIPFLKSGLDLIGKDVPNLTTASLNNMRKNNPRKYELLIFGFCCVRLNLSVQDLIQTAEKKKILELMR